MSLALLKRLADQTPESDQLAHFPTATAILPNGQRVYDPPLELLDPQTSAPVRIDRLYVDDGGNVWGRFADLDAMNRQPTDPAFDPENLQWTVVALAPDDEAQRRAA